VDELIAVEDEFTDEFLSHIGIKRKSGRYPWGSGKDPLQRSKDFKAYYDDMRAQGLSDSEITKSLTEFANGGRNAKLRPITVRSPDLRAAISSSTNEIRNANINEAVRLRNTYGREMSTSAIAKQMGVNESTVRGWLKASETVKETSLDATVASLKEHLTRGDGYLDVGKGTELHLGISETKLRTALASLKDEGYQIHYRQTPQLGTDKFTKLRILTDENKTYKDVNDALVKDMVNNVTSKSDDGGLTYKTPIHAVVPVSSKQLQVRYGDEGGKQMDGVIELRRDVPELSLGDSRYAQVRVAVDGTHYLKGMAMYADDLPAGVNIRFNTNKNRTEAPNKLDALKALKVDPNTKQVETDPRRAFGATVRPHVYVDKNGKEKTSPLNIVNEEGKWDEWSRSLSAQMLSKQPLGLASQQLMKTQKDRRDDFDAIMSLTNPVVKKKLLEEFADNADAAAVHLKAASLPRQSSHVILPITSMRPTEVYAPNFETGDRVVLVRYPHGGPFEIPALTVNNKNMQARRILGGARDAIGIHHSVAEQLSGADFDGDSVLVIPNPSGKVKTRPPLQGLKDFDAKDIYRIPEGDTTTRRMTKKETQKEMGKISNLITDMTIHKATDDELARAVKHSMVVIDAEKHGLNYKKSEVDNNIGQLKEKYQGKSNAGAATIISRAGASDRIPRVKPRPVSKENPVNPVTGKHDGPIDSRTGKKVFVRDTSRDFVGKDGKLVERVTKGSKMEFTDDARTLLSAKPQPMEELYASHANSMKALANEARRNMVSIPDPLQSKAARAVYAKEVADLKAKLQLAEANAPVERRAQIMGKSLAKNVIDSHPEYDKDDIKKVRYQALEEARSRTGANRVKIGSEQSPLTDREWEAIQSGAVSATTLRSILANANMDRVKTLATPRSRSSLTPGQISRARAMVASGKPLSEVAASLGIPRTTIIDNLNR
jgi:predicted DNA binding protein